MVSGDTVTYPDSINSVRYSLIRETTLVVEFLIVAIRLSISVPNSDCVYKDLEFFGDNLRVFPTQQFDECKAACEEHPSCTFFTVTPVVCVLKGDDVSIKQKPGAVSGMTTAACGEAIEGSFYEKRCTDISLLFLKK